MRIGRLSESRGNKDSTRLQMVFFGQGICTPLHKGVLLHCLRAFFDVVTGSDRPKKCAVKSRLICKHFTCFFAEYMR